MKDGKQIDGNLTLTNHRPPHHQHGRCGWNFDSLLLCATVSE